MVLNPSRTLLFLDTETGGLDPEDSLLSIGLAFWSDGEIVAEKEILVKHDHYVVTADGLRINRINLIEHDAKALRGAEAVAVFAQFVKEYASTDYVSVGGHNVAMDIVKVSEFYNRYHNSKWEQRFSFRITDTSSLLRFVYHAGLVPEMMNLDKAMKHFNVELPDALRHTALGDARATALVYTELLKLIGYTPAQTAEIVELVASSA